MGHETVLVSGTNREQVIKDLIERSARRSEYGHGASGVREKNITFNSLEEAYAYIEEQISEVQKKTITTGYYPVSDILYRGKCSPDYQ